MSRSRLSIQVENIPEPLRCRRQWVVWRYVTRKDKPTKVPFNPRTGGEASSTDASTWASFEEAVAAWRANDRWDGIGYVFAADDPFVGVDLDKSIDPATGTLKPWARQLAGRLGSYCEVSPSGTGVKLFLAGRKPGDRCSKYYQDGKVEVYQTERFFTVTGQWLAEFPAEVLPAQAGLECVYRDVFGETEPAGQAPPAAARANVPAATAATTKAIAGLGAALTDEQILEKASRSRKKGQKFAALWAGNWQGCFGSQSEADSSLVFMLAFYTKDAHQLDRLFRRSGLMRPKWDESHGPNTYGERTIANALARVTGQWQPNPTRLEADQTGPSWRPAHLSQQVNAERLAELLAGDALYNTDSGRWEWFDGRRFAADHGGRVARAAKRAARQTWRFVTDGPPGFDPKTAIKHAVDSEKAAGIAAMMKLAETEPGIPVRATDFDANGSLFNCRNGTLDLATLTLRPHDRRDRLTKLAPVAYDPNAARLLFDAFVLRIMNGREPMVRYLQRVLGRCLSADVSEQEVYFFLGEGANGKSVLIDTVLGILGDYAGTAPESLLTVQSHNEHPTEIADLCGRRLVVASETEEGARLKIQLVKRLTGDARLKGRFMRQDFFEFDRTHKLIVVSNNRPLIRETKHAIWRRIRLVPFDVIIPEAERDPQLTQKLRAEWPGILTWLLEGYRDWREGGMRTPPEVLAATESYQSEQDPLGDYLADRCVLGVPGLRVGRNDLYADYQSYCQQSGERYPLSRAALFDHVRGTKGVSEDQWRLAGSTVPVRGFRGIGLAFSTANPADVAELGDQA